MLDTQKTNCPYCGELIEIVIDSSMGDHQQYIEDCFVCCRPIVLTIGSNFNSGEITIMAKTENE